MRDLRWRSKAHLSSRTRFPQARTLGTTPALGHLQHCTSFPHPATVTPVPRVRNTPSPWFPPAPPLLRHPEAVPHENSKVLFMSSSCETLNKTNLPFLCACLQWPSPPNHPSEHLPVTQPPLVQRKSHGDALVLSTALPTFSSNSKTNVLRSTTSLIKKSYLDFSHFISNHYHWP